MPISYRTLISVLLVLHGMLAGALAQPLQTLPGSWFSGDGKFGLVFEKGDLHPYVLYGNCDQTRSRPQARLILEIDPKLFDDAVAKGRYIIVQWSDGSSFPLPTRENLIVEGLSLNESGQYLWSPFLTMSLRTLDRWQSASYLELTIGVREGDGTGFKPRHRYVLPDDNRREALASFVRSCSGNRPY